ncbi:1,4-alpha-glucan branching protein [Nocardia sp. NPDC058176]|uniref:maltokinase N-terminal cap-like domain-containing protein n=1 Tax=Nocardia sp. NPDC058176 TaxID=3346368 RepID=UPI0036DC99E5
MAVIHRTSLVPGKTDLVAAWLPGRQWYRGTVPRLRKAGGFRLDDPDGAVGIEFLLLLDDSTPEPQLYQVPLTYRGAPLPGAENALLGTAEHGTLGRRWIYDATRDPVAVAAVLDLLAGRTAAQAQNDSDTVDSSVVVAGVELVSAGGESGVAVDGDTHTDVPIGTAAVRFHRLPAAHQPGTRGSVIAPHTPDSGPVRTVELVSVLGS